MISLSDERHKRELILMVMSGTFHNDEVRVGLVFFIKMWLIKIISQLRSSSEIQESIRLNAA